MQSQILLTRLLWPRQGRSGELGEGTGSALADMYLDSRLLPQFLESTTYLPTFVLFPCMRHNKDAVDSALDQHGVVAASVPPQGSRTFLRSNSIANKIITCPTSYFDQTRSSLVNKMRLFTAKSSFWRRATRKGPLYLGLSVQVHHLGLLSWSIVQVYQSMRIICQLSICHPAEPQTHLRMPPQIRCFELAPAAH